MAAPPLDVAMRASLTAAFHMSPEELAEKARQQARNEEGQFVEEADVKAELTGEVETVGTTPTEEATPAPTPTEPETIPAGELLHGDVISHEGQTHAVDTVEVQQDRARVSGRPTADLAGPTRLIGDFPADEPVPLASPDAEAAPEPEPPAGPMRLADLGLVKADEKRLRSFMKTKSLTLNEEKKADLRNLRRTAYARIGEELGWTDEEIQEAIETEDFLIRNWTAAGPIATSRIPSDAYLRIFRAAEALRSGKAHETADERALTLMRTYAQMTLAERGEESVPLYRLVNYDQAAHVASAPEGSPVDVEAYPLSSWAVQAGLPSIRGWIGNRSRANPIILRTEAAADQVWMAFHSDERFRTNDVSAKGEYILDSGAGFNSENGLTAETLQGGEVDPRYAGTRAKELAALWEQFPDLKNSEWVFAQTRLMNADATPEIHPQAVGEYDEGALAAFAEMTPWLMSHSADKAPIIWALRDAGVDATTMRQFLDAGYEHFFHARTGSGGAEVEATTRHVRELLDKDPTAASRLVESLAKIRFIKTSGGGEIALYPGEEAHQYGSRGDGHIEVVDATGNRVRMFTTSGRHTGQDPDGFTSRYAREKYPPVALTSRDWSEHFTGGSAIAEVTNVTGSGWGVQEHEEDLKAIPEHWARGFAEAGGRIEVFEGPVTAHPEQAAKRGVTPRGWERTGKTWDDVPGLQQGGVVYLGTEGSHGSSSLALHETGHGFDRALGRQTNHRWLSNDPRFVEAYDALVAAHGSKMDPYYKQRGEPGRQETFGEAFVIAVGYSSLWSPLPKDTPEFQRLLGVMNELIEEATVPPPPRPQPRRRGETSTPAPPPTEWRAKYDEARSKLPEDMTQFGMLWDDEDGWVPDVAMDDAGNQIPGPTTQQHLEALIEVGTLLGEELDRRITARGPQRMIDLAEAEAQLESARMDLEDFTADDETALATVRDVTMSQEWDSWSWSLEDPTPYESVEELYAVASGAKADDLDRREVAVEVAERVRVAERRYREAATRDLQELQQTVERFEVEAEQARAATVTHPDDLMYPASGEVLPGTEAYTVAMRREAITLLAEMRPMGGTAPMELDVPAGAEESVAASLQAALDSFPSDWVADIDEQNIVVGEARRASYLAMEGERPEMKLSPGNAAVLYTGERLVARHARTATHELGHAVEESRPHIRTAQWALSHLRSARSEEEMMALAQAARENGYFDTWADAYTGRVYADNPEAAWEILTTGLESLFMGSQFFFRTAEQGGYDAQFRAFILALLAEA